MHPHTPPGHPPGPDTASDAGPELLLRRTLRRHAAGVTVVTVPGPAGFTATSFTSLSLRPALVSFCVATASSAALAVTRADRFAVHLLGADDAGLAERFARSGTDRFAGTPHAYRDGGLPVLGAAPVWLAARVRARHAVGDHLLVVGEVEAGAVRRTTSPLVRHAGAYTTTHVPADVSAGEAAGPGGPWGGAARRTSAAGPVRGC
ncbi:flavin reductase family protein [Streptomyces chumphonensis]|uniref:Flavin reductase family protein n=1 Tax=Streptomyces chumphonensis TaxID=1214925 RepID=A0A927IDB7_9ACTN|nr:flavin reductase family protein [Streptomyces chumphonensis]MBD3932942.1 flavin reductase family protein [Streptomyces chumphonensis]